MGPAGVTGLPQAGFMAQTCWPKVWPPVSQWFLTAVKTFRGAGFFGSHSLSRGRLLNFREKEAGEVDFPIWEKRRQ